MSTRSRFGRRWRSVSFRAGLWSALSVGIVAVASMLAVVTLLFVLFFVTDGLSQIVVLDQIEADLRAGVEPDRLVIENSPAVDLSNTFWAIYDGGVVAGKGGPFSQEVVDAPVASDQLAGIQDSDATFVEAASTKNVNGAEWFVVERDLALDGGQEFRLIVATEGTFGWWGFVRQALPITVPIVAVLMAVAMLVTSYFTRRALRRVERMRTEVELITQESLDRRVPLVDAADGIDKLAITMNDMLARLEQSSAQQNQFLADASHELRSPVAGLLAQLDVAAAYPDRVDAAELLPKLHSEAERLQSLVNDLLFVSRSEAGEPIASSAETVHDLSIDDMVEAEVAHQSLVQSDVSVSVDARSGASVTGNPRDLERALRNLVDNAVRHASGEVRIGSTCDGTEVVIAVSDDGPGVPPDDAERIFDRFVRLDEARSRDAGGSGLGLAMTRQIARKHRGEARLVASAAGARFELRLPRD